MANIYDDLLTYIAAQLGGSWAKGTNLFYPRFPENDDIGIVVKNGGGLANSRYLAQYYPFITVISRHTDIDTALTNWQSVNNLFKLSENISLSNYTLMFSYGLNSDPILTTDGPRLWEWEGYYSLRYR